MITGTVERHSDILLNIYDKMDLYESHGLDIYEEHLINVITHILRTEKVEYHIANLPSETPDYGYCIISFTEDNHNHMVGFKYYKESE